jgi:hypothetical protein
MGARTRLDDPCARLAQLSTTWVTAGVIFGLKKS